MNKKNLTLILLVPVLLFSQQENEIVRWDANRKLVWDDFKAEPQTIGSTAALTTTHLGFSFNFKNGEISYLIESWFEKNRSWGRVKTDWILQHEQGHFDIAEIFTRKLKKAVTEYQFNASTFQKDLGNIYESIVKEKERYQQLYDDETENSINKPKQQEWLKKIAALLQEYIDFAKY